MSRRLHREIQIDCRDSARGNDANSYPVMAKNGRRIIGYVDGEGNFSTAQYGRAHYVARIFLLSDPYKLRLIRRTRFANVKSMRYGRAYGMRSALP